MKSAKDAHPEPLTEDERRAFHIYGRFPHREGLLGQQSKERRYFDSGDFAVTAAHRMTDNGAIQTGTAHPQRETISRPYAPVPNTSNVKEDANEDLHDGTELSWETGDSPLHQRTSVGDEPKNIEESNKAD